MQVIPVFYRPEMVAQANSFSQSASKPALAVASWQALGVPLSIQSFEPVTRDQIKLAHSPEFVDALLDFRISNGFGNKSPEVAASLPFTSASMLAAAREALRNGVGAVSPTSGFHHAGYAHAGGFCSLNGLMVAALNLPDVTQVGILDFDMHAGDGTEDIIQHLRLDDRIVHYTQGAQRLVPGGEFLFAIPNILKRFEGCDVVLCQLAADPHVADPLGGWLTDEQLTKRDALVFRGLRRMGVPCVWCLAGGYRTDIRQVLDVHDRSMEECARAWLC